MINPLNNLHKEAQNIRLTSAEKRAMLARLHEHMNTDASAVRAPSPYFSYMWRYGLSFAAIMLLVAGGTTYAAQGALPGSPLYEIKTNVTEPAQGMLALSDEAKAQYHANLAETRLEEAETLASKGALDASTSAQIQSSLDSQIAQANQATQSLADKDRDAATEASAQFDASLAAHSAILARLGGDSDNEQTKENSGALATIAGSAVGGGHGRAFGAARAMAPMMKAGVTPAEAPAPAGARIHTMMAISATATATAATTSTTTAPETQPTTTEDQYGGKGADRGGKGDLSQNSRASQAFAQVQAQFDGMRSSLDATTTAQVQARLDAIQDSLNNDDAIGALKASVRLSAFLSAEKQFDNGILRTLLDHDGESEYGDQ